MTNGYSWDWYDYAEPSLEGPEGVRGAKGALASEFGFIKKIRKRNRQSTPTLIRKPMNGSAMACCRMPILPAPRVESLFEFASRFLILTLSRKIF